MSQEDLVHWIPGASPSFGWIACEQPERPFEKGFTLYHSDGCNACQIAARVALTHNPDNQALQELIGLLEEQTWTIPEGEQ